MACAVTIERSGGFAEAPMSSQQEVPAADTIANTSASEVAAPVQPFKLYVPSKSSKAKQAPVSQLSLMIQLAVAQQQNRKLRKENEQLKAANALQMEHQTTITQQLQEQLQQKDAELLQQQQRLALCQQIIDLKQERLVRQEQELKQQKATIADLRQQCNTQRVQMQVLEDLLAVRPEPQPKAPTFLEVITSAIPAAIATSWPAASSSKPHANSDEPAAIDWDYDGDDDGEWWLPSTNEVPLELVDSTEYPETPTAAVSRPALSPRSSNSSHSSGGRTSELSSGGKSKEQKVPEASSWWWWGSSATSSTTNGHSEGSGAGNSNTFSSWWGRETQVDIPAGAAGDLMYI